MLLSIKKKPEYNELFSPIETNYIEFEDISNDNTKQQLLNEAFAMFDKNNDLIIVNDVSYLLFKAGFSADLIMEIINKQNKKLFKKVGLKKSSTKNTSSWQSSLHKSDISNERVR